MSDDYDMTSESDKKINNNPEDIWAKDLQGLESLANFDFNSTPNVSSTNETNQKSLSKTLLDCLGDFPCSNKKKIESDEELEESDEDYESDSSSSLGTEEENKKDENSLEKNSVEKKEKKKKKRKAFGTRRNIKKLLTDQDLDEKVLNARQAEEERINRIIEQQLATKKNFQSSLEKSNLTEDIILSSDDEVQIIELTEEDFSKESEECNSGLHVDDTLNIPNSDGQVLVNVGHPKEDKDVFLDSFLAKKIKPHQIGGIRFMYDCIIENLTKVKNYEGIGCILAHSMGLGKTLQIISFVEVVLRVTSFKHVLCIVPIITIQNWVNEFDYWLPDEKLISKDDGDKDSELRSPRKFPTYIISEMKNFVQRSKEILNWKKTGGVLFIGYEMYRLLLNENNPNNKQKKNKLIGEDFNEESYNNLVNSVKEALLDPGPDLVVCDEGHRIKNCKASTSKCLKEIVTKRRIVLTGYPLQNNLIEYWCMVDFVRPGYLGTKQEFCNMFEKPIQNGQCSDSNETDRNLMRKRAHVLHKLLRGFVQRRSYSILDKSLPKKEEYCILIRMTPIQKKLLEAFFQNSQLNIEMFPEKGIKNNPLYIYSICHKIWNHPDILYTAMNDSFEIIDPDLGDIASTSNTSNIKKRKFRNDLDFSIDNNSQELIPRSITNEKSINYDWAKPIMKEYKTKDLDNSFKMILLFKIIEETIKLGERLLVFSQSLMTLDIIEYFLSQRTIPNDIHNRKFLRNESYFRLDGSTNAVDKKNYIKSFNQNEQFHLFLLSTKAGCLGINLTAANRLVIFDSSWNPCHDAQATYRIYRFGQKKKCFVYRFIFDNSLEKKIFDRQISKQSVSNKVVDEINTDVNLTSNEISSFVEGLETIVENSIPSIDDNIVENFSDPIMKIICKDYNFCLSKEPIRHESLLAESSTTKLSRREKQLAEQEYNIEKGKNKISISYQRNIPIPNKPFLKNSPTKNETLTNSIFDRLLPDHNLLQPTNNHNQVYTDNLFSSVNSNSYLNNSNYTNPNYSTPNYNNSNYNNSNYNNLNYNNSNYHTKNYNFTSLESTQSTVDNPMNSLNINILKKSPIISNTSYLGFNSFNNQYLNNNFNNLATPNNSQAEKFIIPHDLRLVDDFQETVYLKQGQVVYLFKTNSGLILQTLNGRQFPLRGNFENFLHANYVRPMYNNMVPSTSKSLSPEVISLIDED